MAKQTTPDVNEPAGATGVKMTPPVGAVEGKEGQAGQLGAVGDSGKPNGMKELPKPILPPLPSKEIDNPDAIKQAKERSKSGNVFRVLSTILGGPEAGVIAADTDFPAHTNFADLIRVGAIEPAIPLVADPSAKTMTAANLDEVEGLHRMVERLQAENERLTAENKRLTEQSLTKNP